MFFVITSPPLWLRNIAINVSVGPYVGMSVCLLICPLAYFKNHTSKFHIIYSTCYLWPWIDPPLTAMQYIMYFQFCG